MPDKLVRMHIINVPVQLRRDFHAACAREGKTVTGKIRELMEEFVKTKGLEDRKTVGTFFGRE